MAGTATSATGAAAQSQQQPAPESPEVTAARTKYNEAGFARNRAEAVYNAAKKEHGVDSAEAQAAKRALEEAQAQVEQAQAELKTALKLPKKNPAPAPKAPQAKAPPEEPKPVPAEGEIKAPAEPKVGAYLQEHVYVERLPVYNEYIELRPAYHEFIRVLPTKNRAQLLKLLEKALKEQKLNPKNLEYYRKQFQISESSLRANELAKKP